MYSGLIDYCQSPDELAGVIAHELAHIKKGHVKKKIIKEAGLAMLAAMAGGSAGSEIVKEVLRILASTAYDRSLETEADEAAVNYLVRAGIDPKPYAHFLFRLSSQTDVPGGFELISTHPDSKDRSAHILESVQKFKVDFTPSLDSTAWTAAKNYIREL